MKRKKRKNSEGESLFGAEPAADENAARNDTASCAGYQVVRKEFLANHDDPAITFYNRKVFVNAACLKRLADVSHVQLLINPKILRLAVRPCGEDERDSFAWASRGVRRQPKHITCRVLFAKVFDMMNWNPAHRHKLLGKHFNRNGEHLFIFDLSAPAIYQRTAKDDGITESARDPAFRDAWCDQFGLPVEAHRQRILIHTFKEYTIFSVADEPDEAGHDAHD